VALSEVLMALRDTTDVSSNYSGGLVGARCTECMYGARFPRIHFSLLDVEFYIKVGLYLSVHFSP
jgi:hypothetical protein